jgi:predicted ferric reductase
MEPSRNQSNQAVLWIVVYLLLSFAPVLLLFFGPHSSLGSFWLDLSVALGFAGLSLMGIQFIPTARLPFIADSFPLDTLYIFHHRVSVVAFLLTLAHPVILLIAAPARTLAFLDSTWGIMGVVAFGALLLLIASSVWRKELGIEYEPWRGMHDLFAVLLAGLSIYHIFGRNYYSAWSVQRIFWIAMAALWLLMLLYIRVIKPLLLLQRPYEIVEVRPELGETWSLVLRPTGGRARMEFSAGQVAWLTIGHSPFRIEEHPFSFSSSELNEEHLEFAIRELGDFTSKIGQFEPGTQVYVDGPYGTFDIDHHDAPGYVFIAGGIGIAPIMSILRTLADRDSDKRLHLFYGNRSWDTISYREEIANMEEQLNLEVVHILENPPEGWEGETGFMTKEMFRRRLPFDCVDCLYFICGPLPMIDVVTDALQSVNVDLGRIHSEQYEMA